MQINILIIDEDVISQKSMADLLREHGYLVNAISSENEGLSELQRVHFDLLIIDISTSLTSGFHILRQVGSLSPETRVIVITSFGTLESAVEALRQRVKDYLIRPVSSQRLLESVNRSLENENFASLRRGQDSTTTRKLTILERDKEESDQTPQIDPPRRSIQWRNVTVRLTPIEFRLFEILYTHSGEVITHQELVKETYGYQANTTEAATVLRPLVSRLRRKLSIFRNGWSWLRNVHGTGYYYIGPQRFE